MKKLMLTLMLSLLGLAISDANAGFRSCYSNRCCAKRCEKVCPERVYECPKQACKVDRVVEEPCPAVPCCVRYVKVEEPALITKHISYTAECPAGCTAEQQQAGMMHAGEKWQYSE